MTDQSDTPPGRDRANQLMASYIRHEGIYDVALDPSGDASFGEFGFHHDPDKQALTGRVFVAKAWFPDDPPQIQDNFRKVGRALNDPDIGGMFENAGGYFILDETKRMYFLARDFPLDGTTPKDLHQGMEALRDVGATYTMRWFGRIARIAHGQRLPPARPVTREHDDDDT
jgi:hypothetical protein